MINTIVSLPNTWEITNIDDICHVVAGNPAPQGEVYFKNGIYPFVRVQDMGRLGSNTYLTSTKDFINDKAIAKLRTFPKGTVLFTKSGASTLNNQRAILAQDSYVVSHIAAAIPILDVSNKWIYYFLTCVDFANLAHSSVMPSLPLSKVKAIELPLPPINEQCRIVAKIEELFSEIDKGVESLQTAKLQLQVYRQALLKHAFEGKLTEQWRKDNPDKVTPAAELLEQIKQAREQRYQQQLSDWQQAVDLWEAGGKEGKKPSKPRIPKEYGYIDGNTLKELPVHPTGWVWDKLGWMTLAVEYGTSAKSKKEGEVAVLRMGNIQNTHFTWDDLVYTSDDDEINKYCLKAGDVLFNRTNSPELVGKTAIYKGGIKAIFAGYLIRVNQMPEIIESNYLNLYLNSFFAKNYGNKVKTDGVNQSNINGNKLSNFPFPYCSIEEQRVVTGILEEKLSECEKLVDTISVEIKRGEILKQSILKKAFSGQLIEQDPNDEPASELLERIKAEKLALEATAKLAKATTKKRATKTA